MTKSSRVAYSVKLIHRLVLILQRFIIIAKRLCTYVYAMAMDYYSLFCSFACGSFCMQRLILHPKTIITTQRIFCSNSLNFRFRFNMVFFNANLIYNKEIVFTVGVKQKKHTHTHRARTHARMHTRTNARTYFIDKSNVWYSDPTLTLLLNFAIKIKL